MIKMITTGYFEVLPPGVRASGHIVIPRIIWWENTEHLLKGFTVMIQEAVKDTRNYKVLSEVRVVCLQECPREEYDKWKSIRDRKWGYRANADSKRSSRSHLDTGADNNVVDMLTMFKFIESSMNNMRQNKHETV